MKKDLLKDEFIEMRAQGFTLKKICEELDISKPTAVSWAKEFAEDIEIEQINEYAKYMIGEIYEHEEKLYYHIENYRKIATGNYGKKGFHRYSEKSFNNLSRVFKSRVHAVTLVIENKTKQVVSITFVFKKNSKARVEANKKIYSHVTYSQ